MGKQSGGIPRSVSVLFLAGALGSTTGIASAADDLKSVMEQRGLTEKDLLAAAKTYTPSGGRDEYLAFSSGGQSGQVIVYGIPSMRLLKYIGVFTPEPWQGYGFDDESKAVLAQGKIRGKDITYGDTHHPALSETDGDYDGRWLFINDKANPRVAVIDLHDFETKQIVVNPVLQVRARRRIRHAQHRVRDGGHPVRRAVARGRLRAAGGVQRQVPRWPDLLELR